MFASLRALAQALPRVAEEGLDHETSTDTELIERLKAAGVDSSVATALVPLTRHALTLASCLDAAQAKNERWRFASFSAFLFARSLLSGAASDGFRLLDAGFWSPTEANGRRQHEILHQLELLRTSTPSAKTSAIRRVWVAWAMIAVDGRFLLVRREDANPERADSHGSFVLPGGRVAPDDLLEADVHARLDFFDPARGHAPAIAQSSLVRALRRELLEELDLTATEVTVAEPVGDLISYQALEGANGAHALTEYFLQVFRISLVPAGKQSLLKSLAKYGDRFSWFTPQELAAKRNARGHTAFVDALLQLSEPQREPLLDARSAAVVMGDAAPGNEDVDIPVAEGELFAIGDTSRERTFTALLDESERSMLAVLAALRRGDLVTSIPDGVEVASGTGWIIVSDENLLRDIKELAQRLRTLDSRWEPINVEGRAFRLNATQPDQVNYCPSAFSLTVSDEGFGEKYRLRVTRREFASVLGIAPEQSMVTVVPRQLGTAIYELAAGKSGYAQSNWESLKKLRQSLKPFCVQLGMRQLLREQAGIPFLAVGEARLA